jgi:hypothetical protein
MLMPTVFNHIAKWSTVSIQGGVCGYDCFTFAMSWVKASGGPDLTNWRYCDYREVRRLLQQEGFSTLEGYVDSKLIPTDSPKDGDVITVKSTDRFPAFGLWFDGKCWVATGKDAKIRRSESPFIRAWTWV